MSAIKHFDKKEWTEYVANKTSPEKSSQMEEHLYLCDKCLEIYISVSEKTENHSAVDQIHSGFTDRVMEKIIKKPKEKSQAYKLAVYSIAACMTLLITFSGTFERLNMNVKGITASITNRPKAVENIFMSGWSERLTEENRDIIEKIDSNI